MICDGAGLGVLEERGGVVPGRQVVQAPLCDRPARMEMIKIQVHTLRVN